MLKLQLKKKFVILSHWEYWPFSIVYIPIYFYWVWLFIKTRAIFFNASNPLIKNGGFLMESKKEIYDLIPQQYYPQTILVKKGSSIADIDAALVQQKMQLPLIAKPDIGLRGLRVKKINTTADLQEYLNNTTVDFLLQEFISYPNEIGIFYYRFPQQQQGVISGIVGKEYLQVIGNGIATIEELVVSNNRFLLQLDALKKQYGAGLQRIANNGEVVMLVPYGNHSRGSKFIDSSDKITSALEHSINAVCMAIPQFYYGRLDIKYKSWEDLEQGKNFAIIELNGAGSEPTHIYDPKHSIFFAWKEIIRHLNLLQKISVESHQLHQCGYMSIAAFKEMLRQNKEHIALLKKETN